MPISCVKTVSPNTQKHAWYWSQDGQAYVAFIILWAYTSQKEDLNEDAPSLMYLLVFLNSAFGQSVQKHISKIYTEKTKCLSHQ